MPNSTTSPLFHVCTLVNDFAVYQRMRASFDAAGMDNTRCRYTVLDNTVENRHEPYSAINEALRQTTESYLIVCHQDVEMDRGDGFDRLVEELVRLEMRDPNWAVSGNAGVTERLSLTIRITDPCAKDRREGDFDEPVAALDENFLVIRPKSGVRCSSELSGFHLYGTDLCLNAHSLGLRCYVLDFHLRHLSAGQPGSQQYAVALDQLKRVWGPAFGFAYWPTMFTSVFLSRHALLRRIFGSAACVRWVQSHKRRYDALRRLCAFLSPGARRIDRASRVPANLPQEARTTQ